MNYDYQCETCKYVWEETHSIKDRDLPTLTPCGTTQPSIPPCKGKVIRLVESPALNYAGSKSILNRAGQDWNDVLKKISRESGDGHTIQTK